MLGHGARLIAALCIAAAAVAVAIPARSVAATVTHEAGSATMRFDAAPGEANAVTIGASGSELVVSDTGAGALGGGGDCDVDAGSATVSCPTATIRAVEVRTGDGDDRVTNAGSLPATVFGEDGSDALGGGPAGDALDGGPGDDVIAGGAGNDLLTGGIGADGIDGGEGLDAITYEAAWPVAVDLPAGVGGNPAFGDGDRLASIENVLDGQEQGTLTGTAADNALTGGGGEDYVDGGLGTDRLAGGEGPDVVAARDSMADAPVSCGPGVDLAIVDPTDPVVTSGPDSCEQIDDGRQAPRRGRVSVRPRGCPAAGGGEAQLTLPAMTRAVPLRYVLGLPTGLGGRPAPSLEPLACGVQVDAVPASGARAASADLTGDAVTVRQTSGRRITTALTVRRPVCATGATAMAAGSRARRVRLRSKRGRGRWEVRGRFSTGAAEGTDWTTVESCSRTTTIVRSGRVRVYDRTRRRSVVVRGGHTYVAARR
jgi:hypothetical protein